MRILVCGSSGCIGSAVVRALRWRGHRVIETRHSPRSDGGDAMALDFARPTSIAGWATSLAALDVDAIVNCAGTALPGPASERADRLHGDGPAAFFRGAERARVGRIVNVSALGLDGADDGWRAKRRADDALLGLDVDAVVVRPSLVYGPGSRSADAIAALAHAPIQILPRGVSARLQPIHVFELAESIAVLVERTGAARGVYELGGADVVGCRELLAALRSVRGGAASPVVSLAMPLPMLRIAAWLTTARFPSPDRADAGVLRLLGHVGVAGRNAAAVLLGRAPSTLAEGLLVTPPARSASAAPKRTHGVRWLHPSRGVL